MPLINVGSEPNDGTGDSRRLAGQKLNAFVPLIVKSTSLTAPPVDPSINDRYVIPVGATGDWADKVGAIACYQQSFWNGTSWDNNGGWMIFSAETGMTATLESNDSVIRFDGTEWKEILPSGGFPTEVLNVGQSLQDLEDSLGALALEETVDSDFITDGAVTAPKLAQGSVTNDALADFAQSIDGGDWDTITSNGYWMGSSTSNNPLGSDTRWWLGQVIAHNSTWVTQELWDFTTSTQIRHYRRYLRGGTWTPWSQNSGGTILAWAVFDATGTLTPLNSFNVDGITDNAVGDYTIHFTNPMPSTTYGLMGSVASSYQNSSAMPIIKSTTQTGSPQTKTTTQCRIILNNYASANTDRSEVYVAFIG